MNRAGKLVYVTTKRINHTKPIEEPINEPRRLPQLDEEGRMVSPDKVIFLDNYKTRKEREEAAAGLAERLRIERNLAILAYRRDMLNWRKERKIWEWNMLTAKWMMHDDSKVIFPVGATVKLIHECAPDTTAEGDVTYETDSATVDPDDDSD